MMRFLLNFLRGWLPNRKRSHPMVTPLKHVDRRPFQRYDWEEEEAA